MAAKKRSARARPAREIPDLVTRLRAALRALDTALADFRRVRNGPTAKPRARKPKKD
jgi:hypothetical protein